MTDPRIEVMKAGKTLLKMDVGTLVSQLVRSGSMRIFLPYEITVTLGNGQSQTIAIEEEEL